jgi:hypothetical protein
MPSSADLIPPASGASGGVICARLAAWNRSLHYYLGLYLLLFLWLFAFTGLLLNHQWKFTEFWENRRTTNFEREIASPANGGDEVQARDIMRQLGVHGEIEWTAAPGDGQRLDFRVSRPGHMLEIRTDLQRNRATVQRTDLNAWGVMRILHSFTGVRMDDSRNRRDWIVTWAWALTMDAVAAGMIFMVLSSLWMWWELQPKRIIGGIVLLLGLLSCGLFCVGLRWWTAS